MKAMIRHVTDGDIKYDALAFVCPGCQEFGGSGLHMLAVNSTKKRPSWDWDGNLEAPTLSPSIMTGRGSDKQCHSFLKNGVFQFLTDSTHSLAGKKDVPIPDLPAWFTDESKPLGQNVKGCGCPADCECDHCGS